MWRLLGLSGEKSKIPPSRTLPASWYTSPAMYQLERRAIFSRKWILLTHSLRFKDTGDYQAFNHGGMRFFIVLDRTGSINAFHNLCRHRAFPIVTKREGNAGVLSCKYHGWSYGFTGNLAKAPRFDTVDGFDKSQHGLLPIHVHVDKAGFVWVNLDASENPVKWSDEYGKVDESERLNTFDYAKEFTYNHTWDMEVNANWKALIDNYNECYHCATTHPLIASVTNLDKYTVEPSTGRLDHTIINKEHEKDGQFRRSITFFFPSTSVTATSNFFYIQRMIPVTRMTSRIENEVYRHKDCTDEEFAALNAFYKQVLDEDKELCQGVQENLNNGIYINGELHPEKEKGPVHFQKILRQEVMEHRQKEERLGAEIWPAVPGVAGEMKTCKLDEEIAFCSKLEASSCQANADLSW